MTKAELTEQRPEDIRLEKYRSSLISSGGAMVFFALWTVIRTIVQIDSQLSARSGSVLTPMIAALVGVSVLDMILKFYVGFAARVEGLGRKKKRPYIVLGIIIAIVSVLSLVYMFVELPFVYKVSGPLGAIIALVVDATVFYVAMDLVVSALRIRKLEKEMGRV